MSSILDTNDGVSASTSAESFAQLASASAAAAASSAHLLTRIDGRLSSELRPISLEHGLLTRADGSAQWTQGTTSVLVGVYGPVIMGAIKDEKIDRASVVVNWKAAAGQANNLDIERGSYIRQSFEPLLLLTAHPRCKIQINIQVIRDGGCILAAAVNATTLALLDAGISASALLSAVSVAVKEKDKQNGNTKQQQQQKDSASSTSISSSSNSWTDGLATGATHDYLLDPVQHEIDTSLSTCTYAFASTSPGVIMSVVESGTVEQAVYFDSLQLGRAACAHVQQFMKLSMERRAKSAPTE